MKVPRPDTPLREIAREAFVLRELEKLSVPLVPRVLGFEAGRTEVPHLCMTRLLGSPLPQHGPTWPDEVVRDVAGFLVGLHSLPVQPFQQSGSMETLDLESYWNGGIDWLVERHLLRDGQRQGLQEEFARGLERFAPAKHVLLHGDLWAQHCLVAPRAIRLTGIIDFSDSILGPMAWEFASPGYGDWQPLLADAYSQATTVLSDFSEEVEFYRRVRFVCLPAWGESWAGPQGNRI